MNDITDILRHRHGLGLTRDQIAAAVGVSSGTVSHVLERAAAAGLTWPLPEDIDDDALRARLYPPCERDSGHAQPDWDAVIKELEKPRKRRRARLTRRQLWKEYRDEGGGAGWDGLQLQPVLRPAQGAAEGRGREDRDALRVCAGAVGPVRLLRQDAGPAHRARREGCRDVRRGAGAFRHEPTSRRCRTRACATGRWRIAARWNTSAGCRSAGSSTT